MGIPCFLVVVKPSCRLQGVWLQPFKSLGALPSPASSSHGNAVVAAEFYRRGRPSKLLSRHHRSYYQGEDKLLRRGQVAILPELSQRSPTTLLPCRCRRDVQGRAEAKEHLVWKGSTFVGIHFAIPLEFWRSKSRSHCHLAAFS